MASYVDTVVDSREVTIVIRQEAGFSVRYAAQVSCPIDGCRSFYNSSNRNTEESAATRVKNSLRKHLRKKHPLPKVGGEKRKK